MNFDSIKIKLGMYPAAAVSVIVSIVAIGFAYFNWDEESKLISERDLRGDALREIISNENNAKSLARDVERAKALHGKIITRALDFDSTISAQAFFADFVQRAPVRTEGLPVQDSLPTLLQDVGPMAFCSYKVHVTADFISLLKFLHSFGSHSDRSMVVNRIQITEAELDKKDSSTLSVDVAFRLWGRKGEPAQIQSIADKKVVSASLRSARLNSGDKFIIPSSFDFSSAENPFGLISSQSVGSTASNSIPGLEAALNRLKFSIVPFLGVDAVKIYGNSPRRVNNLLEVNVDGKIHRVKIIAITKDSFTVQSASGEKIKISLKP